VPDQINGQRKISGNKVFPCGLNCGKRKRFGVDKGINEHDRDGLNVGGGQQ